MRASSAFVRLFIRGIAWDADTAGASFVETLTAAARAKLTKTATGKVLTGTSAGGVTATYALPPLGDLSPQDVAEVCSTLLDRAEVIVEDNPGFNDEQIKTALLAQFPSVRTFRPDFSCRA